MRELPVLLGVQWREFLNGVRRPAQFPWVRNAFFLVVGLVLLTTVYGLLLLVFRHFNRQPVIGPFLVSRMFSLAFLTFLFMLVYSNVMTSISSHFLSRDLPSLMVTPVRPVAVFLAKAMEAMVGSSWMVVLMMIPLYAAFARVRHAGPEFFGYAAIATVPFLLIPAAAGMAATTGLMYMFPARRMREAMMLLGTAIFTTVMIVFRLMEPEKLVSTQDEMQVFEFMRTLAAPSAPFLPSAWAGRAVMAAAAMDRDPFGYWTSVMLLWGAAAAAWALCIWAASATYRGAWRHSSESLGVRRSVRLANRWLPLRVGPYAAVLLKDLKIFLREPAQWGQMLLLAALILIYTFNLAKIPRDVAAGLRSLLFFLNMGFIGLIITAVAARFLFPMVSLEGGSFALIRGAPVSMERYLWTRWAGGMVPLAVLAACLVAFSIPLLGVDRFMGMIAGVTMAAITLSVSALGIGLGAVFAKFRISNPEEIVTSGGGFAFMGISMVYITAVVFLESQPVRIYYWATLLGRRMPDLTIAVGVTAAVVALTALCVVVPIKLGARSLRRLEL